MQRQGPSGTAMSYGSYGNTSSQFDSIVTKSPFTHHKRRLSAYVVLLCLFLPIALYAAVCAVLSFPIHRTSPAVTWIVVVLGAVAVGSVGALAFTSIRRRFWRGEATRDPYWYVFLTVTMFAAFVFAVFLGLTNWWNNTLPFLEMQTLSVHPAVDPTTMTGMQLMDVGRASFTKGARLDLTRSIGFKNVDRYCVAPIVAGSGQPESYDFWAIGLNCCTGSASDYHCGEYSNPRAHAGLRLMRADQRAFYRLAVQQAEATFNIKAKHPLFFYWMQDPASELQSYRDDATRYYLLGLGAAFFCQLFLLVVATVGYSKL